MGTPQAVRIHNDGRVKLLMAIERRPQIELIKSVDERRKQVNAVAISEISLCNVLNEEPEKKPYEQYGGERSGQNLLDAIHRTNYSPPSQSSKRSHIG
uniref:Transposase n=1 Tax=Ascaris lumbricoides TaxID=6252 RepID=A0A0M3ILW3_ASCLU